MSDFTPGKWYIAPPIFDGDVILAPAKEKGRLNEVVATSITNKADARLIAHAPEMYNFITVIASSGFDKNAAFNTAVAFSKVYQAAVALKKRIDCEEVKA